MLSSPVAGPLAGCECDRPPRHAAEERGVERQENTESQIGHRLPFILTNYSNFKMKFQYSFSSHLKNKQSVDGHWRPYGDEEAGAEGEEAEGGNKGGLG